MTHSKKLDSGSRETNMAHTKHLQCSDICLAVVINGPHCNKLADGKKKLYKRNVYVFFQIEITFFYELSNEL